MTEIKPEETQQELFQEFSGETRKKERFPSLQRPQKPLLISTSIEQIILVSILLILAGCFIFFLGVIRGKGLGEKAGKPGVVVQEAKPRQAPAPAPSRVPAAPPKAVQPAPPAPLPPPRTAVLDLTKPYTIQLVTYKKRDLADKEVAALRKNGYYSVIIPSGDYFQVCAGQYATKEEAKTDLKTLGSRYKDCFLRRR